MSSFWKNAFRRIQMSRTEAALRQFSDVSLAAIGITREQIPGYVQSIFETPTSESAPASTNKPGDNSNVSSSMAA